MLTQRKKIKACFVTVLLFCDFEGFKCAKKFFNLEELSAGSANTIDTIHFLPPVFFNTLSTEEK